MGNIFQELNRYLWAFSPPDAGGWGGAPQRSTALFGEAVESLAMETVRIQSCHFQVPPNKISHASLLVSRLPSGINIEGHSEHYRIKLAAVPSAWFPNDCMQQSDVPFIIITITIAWEMSLL